MATLTKKEVSWVEQQIQFYFDRLDRYENMENKLREEGNNERADKYAESYRDARSRLDGVYDIVLALGYVWGFDENDKVHLSKRE